MVPLKAKKSAHDLVKDDPRLKLLAADHQEDVEMEPRRELPIIGKMKPSTAASASAAAAAAVSGAAPKKEAATHDARYVAVSSCAIALTSTLPR